MLRIVAAGATALFVTASSLAYAQAPSPGTSNPGTPDQASAVDWNTLTDARVNIVKTALQLTPDQEKYWPAVENAIRDRAKNRQARVARAAQRLDRLRTTGLVDTLRNRNPVDFLHRRADALSQRAADLNKLADAWQPLYQTLSPEQKQRMGYLTMVVFRDMRNAVEQQRMQAEEDEAQD
jgi:LTXXQ motif family protein